MIGSELKAFLEEKLRTGEQVRIEAKKASFTGRIFRLMLHEGWIALEHVDGRRRPFWIIQGGRIITSSGEQIALPG